VSAINGPVKLFTCHGLGGNQKWEFNKEVGLLNRRQGTIKGDHS